MKPGGYIRVAVPDINFKNEWYHNMCKPGGTGDINHPAYSHKVFYDYRTLIEIFERIGFKVMKMVDFILIIGALRMVSLADL